MATAKPTTDIPEVSQAQPVIGVEGQQEQQQEEQQAEVVYAPLQVDVRLCFVNTVLISPC